MGRPKGSPNKQTRVKSNALEVLQDVGHAYGVAWDHYSKEGVDKVDRCPVRFNTPRGSTIGRRGQRRGRPSLVSTARVPLPRWGDALLVRMGRNVLGALDAQQLMPPLDQLDPYSSTGLWSAGRSLAGNLYTVLGHLGKHLADRLKQPHPSTPGFVRAMQTIMGTYDIPEDIAYHALLLQYPLNRHGGAPGSSATSLWNSSYCLTLQSTPSSSYQQLMCQQQPADGASTSAAAGRPEMRVAEVAEGPQWVSIRQRGYATVQIGKHVLKRKPILVSAHRFVLFACIGSPPGGSKVYAMHMCDNKRCVNFRHLYWGSSQQNRAGSHEMYSSMIEEGAANGARGIEEETQHPK